MADEYGNEALPEDAEIAAAHPVHTGKYHLDDEARRLVNAKHSKGALIDLVNWLLYRLDKAEKK